MSTAVASVPVAYSASERQAINPWIVAVTVTLATFMELLDAAIANVALPHIAGGLAVSYDESTWVLTGYLYRMPPDVVCVAANGSQPFAVDFIFVCEPTGRKYPANRRIMNPAKWKVAILAVAIGTLCVTWTDFGALAKAKKPGQDSPTDASAITQEKIVRALSAGPTEIASAARIVDTDAQSNTIVLREGSNGFTCMPGNPEVVGKSATCVDAASMQWMADFKAHKPKPTNTVPGITYMLAGATQRSDSDPYDQTSNAISVGPHWMIMWPFDPKTTGLPTTHKPTGAYIMWAGSPYAHLHVMGRP